MEDLKEDTQIVKNSLEPGSDSDSGTLLRDVVVFQLKLVMDGFRDVLLSPLSIVAAIVDVVSGRKESGRYFYRILEMGRKSEVWINLFGAAKNRQEELNLKSTDDYIEEIENMISIEYEKGGLLKESKDRLDKLLARIPKREDSQ